jgi:hypothetical protein
VFGGLRSGQSLNVEAGLNDGICVPLFLIALAVAQAEVGVIGHGEAVELVAETIGYGIVGEWWSERLRRGGRPRRPPEPHDLAPMRVDGRIRTGAASA